MATRTVVCPECDSPLAPGRFACPTCGALVASVATVSRPFMPAEPTLPPVVTPATQAEPPSPVIAAEPAPPAAPTATAAVAEPFPSRRVRPVAAPRRAKPIPQADAPDPVHEAAIDPPQAPDAGQQPQLAWVLEGSTRDEAPPATPAVPSWPEHPSWPPQRSVDDVAVVVEPPPSRVPAGAYLPPSAVLPPGEALPIPSAARSKEAPEEAGHAGRDWSISTNFRLRLGEDSGPLGLPADTPTRVVVLGAGVAALGFLLPWADIVIGSGSIGGYLEQWGLAGPGHLLILALVVGLACLALVAERLPRWVRLGLPSIAVACLLTGLVWPYLVGPFDASIGVYVVAVGAIVMIAGGLLDRMATRHADPAASV